MPLENASTIAELDPANPTGSDSIGEGDNHIRMIKQVLQNEETSTQALSVYTTAEAVVWEKAKLGLHVQLSDKANAQFVYLNEAGYTPDGEDVIDCSSPLDGLVLVRVVDLRTASVKAGQGASEIKLTGTNDVQHQFDVAEAFRGVGIEIIAHRGFADLFPQNTMIAFSNSIRVGCNSIECDVSISANGTPYVFHDTDVSALTDGVGTFTALSDAYINGLGFLELAGSLYEDETIPTFAEFLAFCKRKNIYCYPELKNLRSDADIGIVVQAVVDAGMEDQTMLQSSVFDRLYQIRATYGNERIAVGLLGSDDASYEATIDALAGFGKAALIWQYNSWVNYDGAVSYAKSKGVGTVAWTVNDNLGAQIALGAGVSRLICDVRVEVE